MTATLPADLTARREARQQTDQTPLPSPARPEVRRRVGAAGLLTVFALLAALFGVAVFQAQISEQGYDLDRMEDTIQLREQQRRDIQLDIAELEAPTRMQSRAAEIGLGRSDSIVYLEPDSVIVASVLDGGTR